MPDLKLQIADYGLPTSSQRLRITDYPPPTTEFWSKKRVFITGHTGFKGSWLAFWLKRLGAEIYGYSLSLPTEPSHFKLLKLDCKTTFGDIRDYEKLASTLKKADPEIVFHLAAQPIVRISYSYPIETFSTNLMGTVNLLEASRKLSNLRAIINVTTDKCYENVEREEPYSENDPMGGHDPYSASKACSEIATASYRRSFFYSYNSDYRIAPLLATCRAGNVIGGGDWATDRLIPDMIRAATNKTICEIRNPYSIRPWQHVLEPIYGYMLLAQKLYEGKNKFACAWNFGPTPEDTLPVAEMANESAKLWKRIKFCFSKNKNHPHEAKILRLDCSKAKDQLGWKPIWNSKCALKKTIEWYRSYYEEGKVLTEKNISEYETDLQARQK